MKRSAKIERKTNETEIAVSVAIDGSGKVSVKTSIPFFDHMLTQIARHGFFDLNIRGKGDIDVDFHHTVEDVGICLGEAFQKALGDKVGIRRYGSAVVPLDEALAKVVVDISGRPYFLFKVDLPKEKVGEFDVELVEEFFRAFCMHSGLTLHISAPYWSNLHHIVEAVFKAFARALDQATCRDPRVKGVPSTKGTL
ncbi:MAG: imidazoleglycerol-phosphate dehydratase HisB [Nitrospinota bacterium]